MEPVKLSKWKFWHPGDARKANPRDRQQHSARDEAVKRFDGAGEDGRTKSAGRGWQIGVMQVRETASP